MVHWQLESKQLRVTLVLPYDVECFGYSGSGSILNPERRVCGAEGKMDDQLDRNKVCKIQHVYSGDTC
jgi:hypothetical protein